MTDMPFTREQLISALQHEYELLIHDDPYDPEDPFDMTTEQYVEYLNTLSVEQLIYETNAVDGVLHGLAEYMSNHS